MRHRDHFPPGRPPWWPENEQWPPRGRWHMQRNPFFRRMGCFFITFAFFSLVGLLTLISLAAEGLGLIHLPMGQVVHFYPIGLGIGFFLLFMVFLALRTLRRISMPLDDLLEAADRLAQGDYAVHLEEKGLPEIRQLTRTFNSMATRLKSTDQQRRDMLADVTHELRTPLTIIQGNLEGMLDGMYPADVTRLKSVLDETHILSRLINDLKTLSLAESGALQLDREPTDLKMLILDTLRTTSIETETAGIIIETSLENTQPPWIDPGRIREVLTNLLANSIRYTPRGGTVKIGLSGQDSGPGNEVLIYVQDHGPGIPANDLPHVFERYYKSGDSVGMGLGLAIARYIVEAHGGKISASSEPGSGTKITFTLPV